MFLKAIHWIGDQQSLGRWGMRQRGQHFLDRQPSQRFVWCLDLWSHWSQECQSRWLDLPGVSWTTWSLHHEMRLLLTLYRKKHWTFLRRTKSLLSLTYHCPWGQSYKQSWISFRLRPLLLPFQIPWLGPLMLSWEYRATRVLSLCSVAYAHV